MIAWAARHLFQFGVRLAITLVCCITLQTEGYRCELSTLLIGAALAIVALRLWMPWSRDT